MYEQCPPLQGIRFKHRFDFLFAQSDYKS